MGRAQSQRTIWTCPVTTGLPSIQVPASKAPVVVQPVVFSLLCSACCVQPVVFSLFCSAAGLRLGIEAQAQAPACSFCLQLKPGVVHATTPSLGMPDFGCSIGICLQTQRLFLRHVLAHVMLFLALATACRHSSCLLASAVARIAFIPRIAYGLQAQQLLRARVVARLTSISGVV
eukprot:1139583-Pelagomonas_calceolata.AAC.4